MIMPWPSGYATDLDRFRSEDGLFTSVALTDEANANVIIVILTAWLHGKKIEMSKRFGNIDWTECQCMPLDFDNFLYREKRTTK